MKIVFSFLFTLALLSNTYAQNVSDFYKDQIRLTYDLVDRDVLSESQAEDILSEIKSSAKSEMLIAMQGDNQQVKRHVVVFYSMLKLDGRKISPLQLTRDTLSADQVEVKIKEIRTEIISRHARQRLPDDQPIVGAIVVAREFGPNGSSSSEVLASSATQPARIYIRVKGDGMKGSRVFEITVDQSLEEAYKIMRDYEKRIAKELGSFGLDIESKMDVIYSDGSRERLVFKGDDGEEKVLDVRFRNNERSSVQLSFMDLDFEEVPKINNSKLAVMPVVGIGWSQLTLNDLSDFYNSQDNNLFNWSTSVGGRLEYKPRSWLYIPMELRFDFMRFRQKNNTFIDWTDEGTGQTEFQDDLRRSSWTMNYLNLQLGLGFDFGKKASIKRIEFGAHGGYHLASSTRIRYGDSFTRINERTRGHFNQETYRYGVYLSIFVDENVQNRIFVDRSDVLRSGFGDQFTMIGYTCSVLLF
ncbi:MAG: hypothetical protein EA358_02555 [Flavobacteriales bacterium]|nr:MAG: hypothetical protein EA358_02555 [Flavobacteriales bacterium]